VKGKIADLGHHGALTGLPNRVHLQERIAANLLQVRRGSKFAVFCLDLDNFKNINGTLGHSVGDALLCATSERLGDCVRESDFVARTGGDEFSIILTDVDLPLGASALAERLVTEMSLPFDLGDHQVVISTSVGIAIAPDDGTDADQLLRNADMAMDRAKASGRAMFCFFEPAMDATAQARRALELDLRQAIAAAEFELPNRIADFEALLRWNHPVLGTVTPDQFIPLAEETGLIIPIGDWVIRQALSEARNWPAHLRVAINISPVQFRSKNFVAPIVAAIAASGLAADRVELEITEESCCRIMRSHL
jgi:diguanylate cyclase (GGDEF)-like protein